MLLYHPLFGRRVILLAKYAEKKEILLLLNGCIPAGLLQGCCRARYRGAPAFRAAKSKFWIGTEVTCKANGFSFRPGVIRMVLTEHSTVRLNRLPMCRWRI